MKRFWKQIGLVFLCMILLFCWTSAPAAAWHGDSLELAFIRDGKLWVKQGVQERPVTADGIASWPLWSPDGKWIAFQKRERVQDDTAQLWVYDAANGRTFPVHDRVISARWSPKENLLALRVDSDLLVADLRKGAVRAAQQVVPGISNYSWFPDGSGFLVSSEAHLEPTGWTSSELYKVWYSPDEEAKQVRKFYSLPSPLRFQENDYLAIGTGGFKWSEDGKWIAFIATQTASLSADANVLCLLSADGKFFKPAAEMLAYDEWFKWAPAGAKLGVIAGSGRFSLLGKRLQLFGPPFGKGENLTPDGRVDRSFAWLDEQSLLVARSAAPKSDQTPLGNTFPRVMRVDAKNGSAQPLSTPPAGAGDFDPQVLAKGIALSWVRWNKSRADIWVSNADGSNAKLWVEGIGEGQMYYEHWHWDSVLSWKPIS
ncbi:hypothetical protein CBW65_19370 [Tumebacillus avium]|uniref:Translocation protein TolB n=1 Tax=Tumebacillus avium TaxID=1903704 RepID=A0A1Y0ISX0_9BACL|nr:PD40 domain-containing protein [Tumebacillus avium]ARU62896.1 hypothetical protein CBW65_19370 [Tumebacillus avium]